MTTEQKEQKKRRRSSLAPGRIELQSVALSGTEFYKEIDAGIPTEKKLKILAEKCLQFSSAKLQDEFKDVDGFDDFNEKVKAALMKKFEVMEKSKDFYQACHQTSVIPNPVNEEMDKIIIELEAYISKLRKESDQWDKLVIKYENLQSEDQQVQQVQQTGQTSGIEVKEEVKGCDLPNEVKLSASDYLMEQLDLHEIRKEITFNAKLIPLYMKKITEMVNLLQEVHQTAEAVVEGQIIQLNNSRNNLINENQFSPRRNIQKIFELDGLNDAQ